MFDKLQPLPYLIDHSAEAEVRGKLPIRTFTYSGTSPWASSVRIGSIAVIAAGQKLKDGTGFPCTSVGLAWPGPPGCDVAHSNHMTNASMPLTLSSPKARSHESFC